ncbi:hypothetical protein F5Y15DRAFT_410376 [Xylariaceae sp. FL0016]|nr:hypothetical protein F5Y15DRAFT_410376 [Xylariaceae sp. FL0016]
MPQGTVKKSTGGSKATPRHNKPQPTKKGARVVKAKRGSKADKMTKKLNAGLVAKTEKLLGERAGHLELIGAGKKNRDKEGDKDKKTTGGNMEDGLTVEELLGFEYVLDKRRWRTSRNGPLRVLWLEPCRLSTTGAGSTGIT